MSLELRCYQKRIIEMIQSTNAIVKMPTGSGKTFVAAELISQRLQKYPNQRALMLVPTIDLVRQQAAALETWTNKRYSVAMYHGGILYVDTSCRILVSTPSAFASLKAANDAWQWSGFSICVFDEVHHVLKDHPYRSLARSIQGYRAEQPSCNMQIVGLTASLTYAVDDVKIKKALDSLCRDLNIEKMCSPTDEELEQGGYIRQQSNVEIVETPLPATVVPVNERKPHMVYETFSTRIREKRASGFATHIWDCVQLLEKYVKTFVPAFQSPLLKSGKFLWEKHAKKYRDDYSRHADTFQLLENWYVGLRLLIISWEEEVPLTMQWLVQSKSLEVKPEFQAELKAKLNVVKGQLTQRVPKLECLKEQLLAKSDRFGASFRAIVFVQQRVCAYTISQYINAELRAAGIVSSLVTGAGPITASITMTTAQSKKAIEAFRQGKSVNVLVATATAEEGLDVPSANVVISYNHMKDSVELCQREGRARQKERVFVIMEQRHDRPVARLRTVQKAQERIIADYSPDMREEDDAKARQAQESRERGARSVLAGDRNPTEAMELFKRKTKAALEEMYKRDHNKSFVCCLQYASVLRSLSASGTGASKKAAKRVAAEALVVKLRRECLS